MFILGALGCAGVIPGTQLGWSLIAVGGGSALGMALLDPQNTFQKRKIQGILFLAISATFVTLGILAEEKGSFLPFN